MPFVIRMGLPYMEEYWQVLLSSYKNEAISKNDLKLFKKITKAIYHLSVNPHHPGLNSHEIAEISARFSRITGKKMKVFQSYIENDTPAAGRLYWCYAPQKDQITIVGAGTASGGQ